ncbi:hypothetical protein [Amycolatopsis echigonensis]|uniref:hypothetical protein n=1 Tax=Amycolatopsis echigonensis TaxID=2576905 RepID=UPI001177E271|nr:hypothetical protein [Amycolatopsis niigatensis]
MPTGRARALAEAGGRKRAGQRPDNLHDAPPFLPAAGGIPPDADHLAARSGPAQLIYFARERGVEELLVAAPRTRPDDHSVRPDAEARFVGRIGHVREPVGAADRLPAAELVRSAIRERTGGVVDALRQLALKLLDEGHVLPGVGGDIEPLMRTVSDPAELSVSLGSGWRGRSTRWSAWSAAEASACNGEPRIAGYREAPSLKAALAR